MKASAICLLILVAVLNISLNIWARNAAQTAVDRSFHALFLTSEFVIAFAIGTASLVALNALYYVTQMNPGRGILLMGAISIIGGSLFGFLSRGQRPDTVEFAMLIAIAALLCYRAIK